MSCTNTFGRLLYISHIYTMCFDIKDIEFKYYTFNFFTKYKHLQKKLLDLKEIDIFTVSVVKTNCSKPPGMFTQYVFYLGN